MNEVMRSQKMDTLEEQLNSTKKLWWLHDSYWHATVINEFGAEQASRLNLEANKRFFRRYTQMLLKSGTIQRPESIDDLVVIFKKIWETCFFDSMYLHEPMEIEGNTATWTGSRCSAYESLARAKMTDGYECGCQAIRNGVMKALRLKPIHSIDKSLIKGDGKCVIRFSFEPK